MLYLEMNKQLYFLLFFVLFYFTATAQQYTLNGNSTQDNCHCYTLTNGFTGGQSGSVWNNFKIDLTQSFNFEFTVNLGCSDAGADGIAFVLQPISTSVGSTGNGLGFGGIVPSIGITLDTYQNGSPDNDPVYDHIAIQRNGDIGHSSANNLAGPVTILAGNNNIEDCRDHSLRIKWNATTKLLETFVDEVLRLSITNDLVNTTFGGIPLVYWGFTGSTGGQFNKQGFCTALSPNFKSLKNQKRCFGEPITFFDSTVSFTNVAKIYWDFGDGSPINETFNPVHTYALPGDYIVKQRVVGADGCEETNSAAVRIGSKPVAGFSIADSCVANAILFQDTSRVSVGTINKWFWDVNNNGITSAAQHPLINYNNYGLKNIKLAVTSLEGCVSDTLYKTIRIVAVPQVDFSFTDSVCLGSPTSFFLNISSADGLIPGFTWTIDGQQFNNTIPNPQVTFTTPGNHTAILLAGYSNSGPCLFTKIKSVFVSDKPRAAAKKSLACQSQQFQFRDSSYATDGIAINSYWWDLGNGQFSNAKDPFAQYSIAGPVVIRHVVRNVRGCLSDTITFTLNVSPKPVAKFGIGDVLCNNNKVTFHDSSFITTGPAAQWNWINSDTTFSTQQHPANFFPPGINQAGLAVTSNDGCRSDTTYLFFTVKTIPVVSMSFRNACKLTPVNFSAKEIITNIGINSWHWQFGDGALASGNTAIHTYTANGDYDVKLYGISSQGCSSDTISGKINIYGTNAFAGSDIIAAANEPVQLKAIGGLSYLWTPGAGYLNNDTIANPVARLTATQVFRVKAFTPEGCESYDEVKVSIYKGPDMYMPSAFTPNGDGLNDHYFGLPVGIKTFNYMRVLNRWGQTMYSTVKMNEGWDGRYKGTEQASGTYVVMVSCVDFRGKLIEKKATFQLIR